jgi:hypothetical protein
MALGAQGVALPGELVDDSEPFEAPAAFVTVEDEVPGPDVVVTLGAKAGATVLA